MSSNIAYSYMVKDSSGRGVAAFTASGSVATVKRVRPDTLYAFGEDGALISAVSEFTMLADAVGPLAVQRLGYFTKTWTDDVADGGFVEEPSAA